MIIAGPWQKITEEGMDSWLFPGARASIDLSDLSQQVNPNAGTGLTERGSGLFIADSCPDGYTLLSYSDSWDDNLLEIDAFNTLFNVTLPNAGTIKDAVIYCLTRGSDPGGEGTPPLWPTLEDRYKLTIHFGNNVYKEDFTRGHEHAYTKWIFHIQHEVRNRWAENQELTKEWLAWIVHEITTSTGVAPNISSLVPADLISEGCLPTEFHTIISDNFNINGGAFTESTNAVVGSWRSHGYWYFLSNVAYGGEFANNNMLTHTSALSGSNHYSQVVLQNKGTNTSGCGITVRKTSATADINSGYVGYWRMSSSSYRGGRFVAGTFTQVCDSGNITPVNGDTIKLQINGSTLTIYRNGTQVATGTDTTYASGSYVGLWHSLNTPEYTTFYAEDLSSGGGGVAQETKIIIIGGKSWVF